MSKYALWVALSWAILYIPMLYVTNSVVDSAYMDEMFHFHQVIMIHDDPRTYKWNSKITTPSGLYWVTLLLTGWLPPTLYILRITSALFNACSLGICFELVRKRSAAMDKSLVSSWLVATKIMTFPPLFFFGHMYYTDPGGLFFVLAAWLAETHQRIGLSLLLGAVSMWFRQTNAIWVLFIGGVHFCDRLRPALERPASFDLQDIRHAIFGSNKFKLSKVLQECVSYGLLPIMYVLVTFLSAERGSFVHGDEAHHQFSAHWAQLCYFSVVVAWFSGLAIIVLINLREALSTMKVHVIWILILLALATVAVHWFSITHPFILADNRHFTFYVWSKFFRKYWFAKYSLVPAYALAGFFAFRQVLRGTQSFLTTIGFVACVVLSLVPLPLVEPRYFIVPFVIFCILTVDAQSKSQRDWSSISVIFGNALLISCVAYLFWFQPFNYTDGSVARFMW